MDTSRRLPNINNGTARTTAFTMVPTAGRPVRPRAAGGAGPDRKRPLRRNGLAGGVRPRAHSPAPKPGAGQRAAATGADGRGANAAPGGPSLRAAPAGRGRGPAGELDRNPAGLAAPGRPVGGDGAATGGAGPRRVGLGREARGSTPHSGTCFARRVGERSRRPEWRGRSRRPEWRDRQRRAPTRHHRR